MCQRFGARQAIIFKIGGGCNATRYPKSVQVQVRYSTSRQREPLQVVRSKQRQTSTERHQQYFSCTTSLQPPTCVHRYYPSFSHCSNNEVLALESTGTTTIITTTHNTSWTLMKHACIIPINNYKTPQQLLQPM